MGATPYANGGRNLVPLRIPPLESYALQIDAPGATSYETTKVLGELMRDIYRDNSTADHGGNFRLFSPDETASNRLQAVFEVTDRCWQLPRTEYDDGLSPEGRVMEVLSEHLCQGWLEGYLLTGRHGLFATYEAFAMVSVSMLVQHAKWLQHAVELPWREPVSSLNVLLTSTCWRNDHNGFSHQGPGMIDAVIPLSPEVVRVWLPPDSNTLLSVADHCFRSKRPRERAGRRQAVPSAVPDPRAGQRALRRGGLDLGVGRHREDVRGGRRRRTRHRAGRRRRRTDPGDPRRGPPAARMGAVAARPDGERHRSDGAAAPERSPARPARAGLHRPVHPRHRRRLRVPRLPARSAPATPRSHQSPSGSTSADSTNRAPPQHLSTWWCSTR